MAERIKYIVNILIVALLVATVAIQRDARIMGHDVDSLFSQDSEVEQVVEVVLDDGTRVISSAPLAKDVAGFGGRTPVKLYVKDDVIQKVEVEPNSETPSFFEQVVSSGLLDMWNGLRLSDALALEVDVVSGATYTSVALTGNIARAVQYAANVEAASDGPTLDISFKDIMGVLVILLGVFITLLRPRNKHIMSLYMVLNIVVLGFWCGSFLSLTTLTAWMSNGVNLSFSLVTFTLLCVVIILPLLGKKGSYCQLHCPMGSAQELLSSVPLTKIKINPKATKLLNSLRYYILIVLLFIMWLGVGFDLMNYEVFSAFIFMSASTFVLVMAGVFLLLSLFIHRPYCRFICPTGALITIAQKTK
ncbi:MAG: 4Fe-4S binding protein [Rikenellaceae bacterium]